ncbi:MAG: Trk system potassium transporter TrkA [Myxococcales bacterium]|nr:Trk system potassium transporter TrkA [Myxococcales bacterium]
MYIVVIGLGQVGRHVVRTLEWEKHDVVAVDSDPEAIRVIEDNHDVMTLLGYGASQRVLRDARVAEADLVVAVTDHDEVNLIAALAARQLGAKRAVARVQGNEWSGASGEELPVGVQYGLLGVDVVFNPRVLLAQELAKIAQSHSALEVLDLANDRIEVVQVELGQQGRMLRKPLAKLELPTGILVGAVVRDGRLFIPGGADVLLPEDRVYLIGLPERMMEAEDLFVHRHATSSVCIVGGGVIGESLARMLASSQIDVMLIERDPARAVRLAERLPTVTVVTGDGTQMELLKEQRVGSRGLFAAVTSEDEVNLMAGLLARRLGVDRTVCLVHRPDYGEIYRQLGIDIVVSPRTVASDHVLRHCRQHELQSLTVLEDGQAEILELVAHPEARIVGVPLRRLALPRGALLAAVLKGDTVIIPGGDDEVDASDTVVVLTTPAARASIARLFVRRSA